MTIVYIEEKYLIVDRGGGTYVGELVNGFKPHIPLYTTRWFVMDCLVQWDAELEILLVLLG